MSRGRRPIFLALGLAAALAAGGAAAQQPPPPPAQGLPAGHPPIQMPGGQAQPGQPGQPGQPQVRQLPGRPNNLPPPGGRQLPPGTRPFPGRPVPGPGGRAAAERQEESEHGSHGGEEHCPGHGPDDPPPHVNWWRGLIGVNNEAAESESFINQLLWRYESPTNPCDKRNEPPPFLAAVLNFGLLAFILYRFGKKPVAEALVKRKQAIMGEIDNAEKLEEDSRRRLEEYKRKLALLDETLAELKAEYAAQAEAEKKALLTELEERRARMRRDAEFRIEQELKAARAELLQEAVRGAVAAAERILQKEATEQDLERLAEDYLHAIPAAMTAREGRRPEMEAHASGAST
jgi:F-type H+-transporting ATPase subunit b